MPPCAPRNSEQRTEKMERSLEGLILSARNGKYACTSLSPEWYGIVTKLQGSHLGILTGNNLQGTLIIRVKQLDGIMQLGLGFEIPKL